MLIPFEKVTKVRVLMFTDILVRLGYLQVYVQFCVFLKIGKPYLEGIGINSLR